MFEYQAPEYIQHFIKEALQEDLGYGDHTSLATVPASATGSASLLVKDTGVLAGVELAKAIFSINAVKGIEFGSGFKSSKHKFPRRAYDSRVVSISTTFTIYSRR